MSLPVSTSGCEAPISLTALACTGDLHLFAFLRPYPAYQDGQMANQLGIDWFDDRRCSLGILPSKSTEFEVSVEINDGYAFNKILI